MGCQPTVVEWRSGNVRSLVSGRGAMARCGSESSSPESHGSGDDFLQSAEFLLRRWNVGPVVDRMDLGQHRMGYAREKELARATHARGGSRCLAAGRSDNVEYPSSPGFEASAASRALLLRLAATSAGRCMVELERTSR